MPEITHGDNEIENKVSPYSSEINREQAALKASTAMNQQKFVFGMKGGEPAVKIKGMGPYTKTDLGIVAYHF